MNDSLAPLVRNLAATTRWLSADACPEKRALATPIVGKVFNPDSLRVQDLNAAAAHVVIALREGAADLSARRLKFLRYIHVAKVILIVQIVNRKPLDLSHLLAIGQR